jgi:hypothetical protein
MPVFKKGAFTFILAVLIILGLTATSFANPGKGNSGWKDNGKGNWKAVQFKDVGSHWAAQSILQLYAWGIVSGYPDLTFKPNAPVSRYEALMMICRASEDGYDPDEDLSWEGRLEECLDYAEDVGIIDDADDFEGWKPAKRYEVAVWAMRARGLETDGDKLDFNDIDEIPDDALPYIKVMFKHKYMVGYPGLLFQPNKPVTRAELSAIIYRMLGDWQEWYDGDFDNLSTLEGDLSDNYDSLGSVEIKDITLTGNEDKVKVLIKVDLGEFEDEWDELNDSDIEDWLADLVGDIQEELADETKVEGKIADSDTGDTLVEFDKDGTDDLNVDIGGSSGGDLSDLESTLVDDYDYLEDVRIDDITLDGDEDDVEVTIEVDLRDFDSEYNDLSDSDIENFIDDIVSYIQDEYSEDTVVTGVITDINSGDDLVDFTKDGTDDLQVNYSDSDYR